VVARPHGDREDVASGFRVQSTPLEQVPQQDVVEAIPVQVADRRGAVPQWLFQSTLPSLLDKSALSISRTRRSGT